MKPLITAAQKDRTVLPRHLRRLEAESIEIMREVVAEFKKPVMLYSIGKDSSVMLHLALKAFYPAKLPFPLLHVDTTWKFREMIAFRDETAQRLGLDLIVHVNEDGLARGINPIASGLLAAHPGDEDRGAEAGARSHTASMPPSAARGATRRKAGPKNASSRSARRATAGTRAISGRNYGICSIPGFAQGETMRVFPLSNWTELDVWEYIMLENIPVVPLYFAARAAGGATRRRPDHGRRRAAAADAGRNAGDAHGPVPHARMLSADAAPSSPSAGTIEEIVAEMQTARVSERQGRLIDSDEAASMEKKKREGYF